MSDITRDYSFGGWIRHYRVEKELTLRKYAELIDMDVGNLSKLERSELDPPRSMERIRELLKPLELQSTQISMMMSIAYSFHVGKFKQEFSHE